MASTQDDGFHEIQLNGKQLVFLFMAGTVVAVVIFLLGVFVGRGLNAQSARSTRAEQLVADNAPSVPDPAPAPATSGGEAPPSASEDLSYPARLAGEPPRESLGAAGPARPEPARSEPARSEPAPPEPAPRSEAAAPPPAAAPASTPSAGIPTEPAGDGFAIQLAALGKREEAERMVRRLADKGYPAYLIAPSAGAPAVFRVRVGKFQDRREAEEMSARLQKEEQFKPWIVR